MGLAWNTCLPQWPVGGLHDKQQLSPNCAFGMGRNTQMKEGYWSEKTKVPLHWDSAQAPK